MTSVVVSLVAFSVHSGAAVPSMRVGGVVVAAVDAAAIAASVVCSTSSSSSRVLNSARMLLRGSSVDTDGDDS